MLFILSSNSQALNTFQGHKIDTSPESQPILSFPVTCISLRAVTLLTNIRCLENLAIKSNNYFGSKLKGLLEHHLNQFNMQYVFFHFFHKIHYHLKTFH